MADLIASGGQVLPATTASPPLVRVGQPAVAGPLLERLKGFTSQPAVARSLPAVLLLGLLGLGALIWSALAQPPQRDLFAGMADGDKAAVADALKSAGVDYAVDRSTGAVTVSESDYYRAKMLLAQQGLPKGAPEGASMIASLPMGASRAVEGERLRSAQEADLARTIEAIDAVEHARVHLAVEPPSVFLRDRAAPAASVMLKLRNGRQLSDTQVRAIAQLVAASVSGMSADDVSIVDQSGRLLSGGASDPAAQATMGQIAVQNQVEGRYADALAKLLTPLLGAGNFTAEVHADLDFTETQATRESYPKDTAVVRTEQGQWSKDQGGSGANAGGIPGYLSNQAPGAAQVSATAPPPPAAPATPPAPAPGAPTPGTQQATAAPVTPGMVPSDRTSETFNRTFELGREVSVIRNPSGTVRRLSVAVALRDPEGAKPRSKVELAALEKLIQGAVGYDQARGDLIAVTARKFASEPEVKTDWWEASWVGMLARNLSALVVAALVVFGIGRPLLAGRKAAAAKAAETKAMQRKAIGGEINAALASETGGDPGRPVTLDMIEASPNYQQRAQLIRNFVKQDPARAALVVRDLIRADMIPAEAANG